MDRRFGIAWAVTAMAVLGLGYLLVAGGQSPRSAAPPAGTLAQSPPLRAPAAPASSVWSELAIPPGLSSDEWLELQTALADHPQREAEIARIADYLGYRDQVLRFRQLREQAAGRPPSKELKALASSIDSGLQRHLDRREITAGEALQLRSGLLEVLEPNPAARKAALTAWHQEQQQAALAAQRPDPRQIDFEQKQAALVANWSALPAERRDPQALENQLEVLRHSVFTPPR